MDHIKIFKIECRSISANGKLKLQQFPTSLNGDALRWFNNRLASSIKTWEVLILQFSSLHTSYLWRSHWRLSIWSNVKESKVNLLLPKWRGSELYPHKLKEIPYIKEVKICAMNVGPTAWFLSGWTTFWENASIWSAWKSFCISEECQCFIKCSHRPRRARSKNF